MAFKRRFFASMAAKMPKNRVITAILAENMGYRACGDRYGQKGSKKTLKHLTRGFSGYYLCGHLARVPRGARVHER